MDSEQLLMMVIRTAQPSFRNRYDKVAFAVNAVFVAAGYVLRATGSPAFPGNDLSSSSADVGIDNWNAAEDNYAFEYSKPEKGSKKVLVKCLVMNDTLLVDVLKGGEPMHLEVSVGDYVEDNGGTNYDSQFKNLGKLAASVKKEILDKLDGASVPSSSSQPSSSERMSREDRPEIRVDDPEDPYICTHQGFIVPPLLGSGRSDHFPGPGAGMYPSRGGDFGGGSMLMGPNDPMFIGGGTGELGFHRNRPGVPPGARFDPYGPPGVPGFEPGRFVRDPRRREPHPDLQHFRDGADFI